MFKLNLKDFKKDAAIHAVIRMNQAEYLALRKYMHCADGSGSTIWFPQGVSLVKRGYGWYRLSAQTPMRAIEKMAFAQKVIRRFLKDEESKVDEALKFLAPVMIDASMRAVSYSTEIRPNGFGYLGNMAHARPVMQPRPAQLNQLQALAAKFSRPNK